MLRTGNSKNRFLGRLRMGVAGCGKVFEYYHLPALMKSPDWRVVSICDPLKQRRDWAQNRLTQVSMFESFPALLQGSSLDALLITTPPTTHCQLAIQALDMGLHVLVEKPMALNTAESLLMLKASRRAKKHLWVSFNRRFKRPYLSLRDKLTAFPVDSIQSIRFELILNSHKWESITPYLGKDLQGGGVLDDVVTHQIDLLPWLIGEDVKAVKAEHIVEGEARWEFVRYKLKFKNNLVAECVAAHGPAYSEHLEIQLNDRRFIAYSSGVLETRWMPTSLTRLYCVLGTFFHFALHKLTQAPNVTQDSIEKQLRSFAATIRSEKGPFLAADTRSGVRSVETIQACRASLESGGGWRSLNS